MLLHALCNRPVQLTPVHKAAAPQIFSRVLFSQYQLTADLFFSVVNKKNNKVFRPIIKSENLIFSRDSSVL